MAGAMSVMFVHHTGNEGNSNGRRTFYFNDELARVDVRAESGAETIHTFCGSYTTGTTKTTKERSVSVQERSAR
jgi:hypothetical protein